MVHSGAYTLTWETNYVLLDFIITLLENSSSNAHEAVMGRVKKVGNSVEHNTILITRAQCGSVRVLNKTKHFTLSLLPGCHKVSPDVYQTVHPAIPALPPS